MASSMGRRVKNTPNTSKRKRKYVKDIKNRLRQRQIEHKEF